MSKSILIAALLIAASLSAGCRRVVLVSFTDKNSSGLAVDTLAVAATDPVKEMRVLGSLSATLGYFDISTPMITLHTVACGGGEQLAVEDGTYPVMNDAVVVGLSLSHQHHPCPIPGSDAGYGGAAGADGGSEAGASGGSGAGGSGGGTAGSGGSGGMTVGPGGADGGDTRDSTGGDTSDAGADSAECGTDTHAPACDPPTPDGTTAVGPPATYSDACNSYCTTMQNCTGVNAAYDDMETCRRYCNEAGWATMGNGRNTDNSLGCRTYYANVAATVPVMAPNACAYAGPSGGNVCGTQCEDFCTALGALCPTTSHLDTCMSTCGAFPMGTVEPQCRFAYLQKTVMNRAFCDFANFGSCLSCAN